MEKNDNSSKNRDISIRKTQKKLAKLIEDLEDEDFDVQCNAVIELGKIKDERAAEALVVALKGEDLDIQYEAEDALMKMGEIAVEPLIKALKSKDCYLRDKAAEILERIGDPRAIEPLIQALEDTMKDEDIEYGIDICEIPQAKALLWIAGPIVESLIKALKERGRISWVIEKILEEIGTPAVEPLIKTLEDEDRHVRRRTAETLAMITRAYWTSGQNSTTIKKAVWPLIRTLKDKDEYVRKEAAEALGEIADERAIRFLVRALDDDSIGVREAAKRALEKIGEKYVF